jgi:hypothetical protein
MRFGFLVAMMIAGGALMGTVAQLVVGPQAQNSSGAPTQEFHWAKIKFDISDLSPIKLIYDEVKKQVETDANHNDFAVSGPVINPDFPRVDAQFKFNTDKFQNTNKSGNISQLPEADPR